MHFNNSEKSLCLEVYAMINQHIELNMIFSIQIKISFYFLSALGTWANTWWFFKKINACSLGYIIFLVFITCNDNSSFSFVILVICTFSLFFSRLALLEVYQFYYTFKTTNVVLWILWIASLFSILWISAFILITSFLLHLWVYSVAILLTSCTEYLSY